MSNTGITRVAVIIAAITTSSLLGSRASVPLAIAIALLVVEQVLLGGKWSGLLGAWFDWRSPTYRERVIQHEAGHLTAACVLGIPVVDYVLDPIQAFRRGYPEYGGIQLDRDPITQWQQDGKISKEELDRYGTFWMAGGAAEYLYSAQVKGDRSDQQQVVQLLSLLRSPSGQTPDPAVNISRYRRQAKDLLDAHPTALATAVDCLGAQQPLQTCLDSIQAHISSSEDP
ncbi:MAG: hypothetical protein HC924_02270 [Synechococcaceae cyanobacterium SM2_3_2]|nr:hypothetical protein [Synechococcaceae cyanobacterium SM2_3_2]